MKTQLFNLPSIYCPIESAIHPRMDDLVEKGIEWIDTFRIANSTNHRARMIACNIAKFGALTMPTSNFAGALSYVNWTHWAFAIDDFWESTPKSEYSLNDFTECTTNLLRAFETPTTGVSSNQALVVAFQDIVDQARVWATPNQMRRLTLAHHRWFSSVRDEIDHRFRHQAFSLEQCMSIRLVAAAGPPASVFSEIGAVSGEIPEDEFNSSTVQALHELFCMIVATDNDMLSFHKEFYESDQMPANIVDAAAREYRLTYQEAVNMVIAMRDRMMSLFLRLRDQVVPHASEALITYLTDLGHQIRGNIEWSLYTLRYTTFADPASSPMWAPHFPGWSSKSSDESLDPLPFKAIAWCWEELRA
jgi:hypothetical protein